MSKYINYLSHPETLADFMAYAMMQVVAEYDARNEVIPRHSFQNGKLQTDSDELRVIYRENLKGALRAMQYLDIVQANKKRQAEQQGNPDT